MSADESAYDRGSGCREAFSVHVDRLGSRRIVTLDGELDLSTASVLEEALSQIVSEVRTETIEFDLSRLDYLDATGLSLLVKFKNHAETLGAAVILRDPQPHATRVLEITNLDGFFRIQSHTPGTTNEPD